jgi:hypothetical protein
VGRLELVNEPLQSVAGPPQLGGDRRPRLVQASHHRLERLAAALAVGDERLGFGACLPDLAIGLFLSVRPDLVAGVLGSLQD